MKLNLNQRLLIITSLTVLLTGLAIFLLSQQLFAKFLRQRFEEKLTFFAKHLASSASIGLLLQDEVLLERLASSIMRERDIVAVVIENARHQVLVQIGNPSLATAKIVQPVRLIPVTETEIFPSPPHPRDLGKVQIYYSTSHFNELLKDLFWQTLIVSLLLAIFMGTVGYLLIARAFIKPLNELRKAVKRVSAGDLSVEVSGRGLPETEELARAFTQMIVSLKESHKRLEKTYQEMLINRSMAEIGRFSLMIAHEIKNPLGIIKGSLDILRKKEVGPEIKEQMLNYIEDEVQRLNNLIQNFLSFARPQKIKPHPININQFLLEVANRAQIEFGQKKILVRSPQKEIIAPFDPNHLERALINLIKNAFEAGAQKVYLSCLKKGKTLIIEVADDGRGIKEKDQEEIFKPFYTTKAKGTGLGLTIVSQVVTAHNGRIEVKDNQPQGTIFRLVFENINQNSEIGGINGLHSSS